MQKKKSKFTYFLVLLSGTVLFTACQKQPPVQNLSSNLVVLTNHDSSADFKSYKTFVLSDSIAICNSNPILSFWSDSNARTVIREVAKHRPGIPAVSLFEIELEPANITQSLNNLKTRTQFFLYEKYHCNFIPYHYFTCFWQWHIRCLGFNLGFGWQIPYYRGQF